MGLKTFQRSMNWTAAVTKASASARPWAAEDSLVSRSLQTPVAVISLADVCFPVALGFKPSARNTLSWLGLARSRQATSFANVQATASGWAPLLTCPPAWEKDRARPKSHPPPHGGRTIHWRWMTLATMQSGLTGSESLTSLAAVRRSVKSPLLIGSVNTVKSPVLFEYCRRPW